MSEATEPIIMTRAKVRVMYFTMFMTFMTTLVYPTLKQKYPKLLATEEEHEMIQEDFKETALNLPTLMKEKHDKEVKELKQSIRTERNQRIQLANQLNLVSEDLQAYKDLFDGIEKQTNFNTYQGGVRDEVIFDLMRKDDDCSDIRYSRRKVDRYTLFLDWYDVTTLQPVIAGSGCRIKVSPFDRNSIQIR